MKKSLCLLVTALALTLAVCAASATSATSTDMTDPDSIVLNVEAITSTQIPEELVEFYRQQMANAEWVSINENGELVLNLPATIVGETDWQGFSHSFSAEDGGVQEVSHEIDGDMVRIVYRGAKDGVLRMTFQQKVKGRANGQRVLEITVQDKKVTGYSIVLVDDMTGLNNPEAMINGTWRSIGDGSITVELKASRLDFLYELDVTRHTSADVTDTWHANLNYNGGNGASASLYGMDFQHTRETHAAGRTEKTKVGDPVTVMVVINNGTLTVNSSEDELSGLLFAKD